MTSPSTPPGWNATEGIGETSKNRTAELEFYRRNYDKMTGLRIAGTLGGFFVLVLAMILYKSKCKKSSREPSPVPMDLGPLSRPALKTPRLSVINCGGMPEHSGLGVNVEFTPYMNQVNHMYFNSPSVLLTAANSESSEEDLSLSGYVVGGGGGGRGLQATHSANLRKIQGSNNNYGHPSPPNNNMKCLKQSIDIHVILPTPTISPSSSENFTRVRMKKDQELLIYDDCVSVNESMSESEMSALVPPTGALCFLENLKYVDDTSSENIPTRTSDFDDQDNDSRRSIGSDSVFACYDSEYGPAISIIPPPPPPPPLTPPPPKRRPLRHYSKSLSMRDKNGGFCDNEDDDDCECRMTLTEAQVHHRDSCCGSELESINDYMESHRRRSSSTQTTLSDLRRCLNSNVGSIASNASSTSQSRHSPNPFPILSPFVNFNAVKTTASSPPTFPSHFSTSSAIPIPTRTSLLSHTAEIHANSPPDNSILLRVTPVSSFNPSRKRSFDALKKTDSVPCEQQSNQVYL